MVVIIGVQGIRYGVSEIRTINRGIVIVIIIVEPIIRTTGQKHKTRYAKQHPPKFTFAQIISPKCRLIIFMMYTELLLSLISVKQYPSVALDTIRSHKIKSDLKVYSVSQ